MSDKRWHKNLSFRKLISIIITTYSTTEGAVQFIQSAHYLPNVHSIFNALLFPKEQMCAIRKRNETFYLHPVRMCLSYVLFTI